MLPTMFTNTKRNLIAGVTAIAVLASGTAPALAWSKNEQNFAKGVFATLLIQGLIRSNEPPGYRPPVYAPHPPVYYQPQPRPPVYYPPVQPSLYNTPTAQAFASYTLNERRRIQSTLSAYGYYSGRIDGSFGPSTYNAVQAYASQTNRLAMLDTRGGAYGFLDGLLF